MLFTCEDGDDGDDGGDGDTTGAFACGMELAGEIIVDGPVVSVGVVVVVVVAVESVVVVLSIVCAKAGDTAIQVDKRRILICLMPTLLLTLET